VNLGMHDKAVLVTGGSRGIGRAIALAFSDEGAAVGICARDARALDRTAAEIEARAGRCVAVRADLAVPGDCLYAVEEVVRQFGRLDVLVNNASSSVDDLPGDFDEMSDDDLRSRLVGKAEPAIWCTRAALPHLRACGSGRIVFIGGISARTAAGGVTPGGGTIASGLGNAAITNFAKLLSARVIGDGILVNVVHPGNTKTDRYAVRRARKAAELGVTPAEADAALARSVPLGRMIEPDDVASLVVFLSSARADAITGQTIAVDGGAAATIVY
jgi:NAD(P)-dependent dehydrogenase (short-subunit alcohol dehydrogenase family)